MKQSIEEKYHYWMGIAERVGSRSKCLSRKIGAVLVTPDGTIIGTGYNGPARDVPHCDSVERLHQLYPIVEADRNKFLAEHWGVDCPRRILGFKSGEGLHLCIAGHAERNIIANSAREGVRTKGCYIVCACPLPCSACAAEIINAGIVKVICYNKPDYDEMARWQFVQAGVEIIQL